MPDPGDVTIRRLFGLFNDLFGERREEALAEGRDLFVPSPEIVPLRAALEGTSYTGPTAIEDFVAASSESWSELSLEVNEVSGCEPHFLVTGTLRGRGRESGAPVDRALAWVTETSGGKVSRIRTFGEEADAVRAYRRGRLDAARLYFVCDARPRGRDPGPLLDSVLAAGVDMIQLREKELADDDLVEAARAFHEVAEAHGALFILNDRPDLVDTCGADGVHVGQEDLPVAEARGLAPAGALVGLSTHSEDQVRAACSMQDPGRPDQISVGPIWETPTKEGRPATGLGLIEFANREATLPWFAIGGIEPRNVHQVVAAGAERLVVVRSIRDADDPAAAARALRAALEAGATVPG